MTKKTDWFPANVKPVRKGWYETKCECGRNHWWNGRYWQVDNLDDLKWMSIPWRGLTKEVK